MNKLVIQKQELVSPEKIVNFGIALIEHKKKVAEWEKEFRNKTREWLAKHNESKIETDIGSIQQARDSEIINYDVDTVERVLGEEYIKKTPDNTKINKELSKLRDGFTPEQKGELSKTALINKRKGNIIIKIKKMLKNLFDLQAELKPIGKNADGYQYRYADLEQVWNKIHNLIHKYNFVVYHSIKKSGVKTIAWHESGDKLSSFIPFGGELKPQDKGSEITYYKRYNIGAIFNLIIAGEDDDANSSQKNQEPFKGDEYADDNLNVAPPLSERIAKYSDMEK